MSFDKESLKFRIGEYVLYKNNGICVIEDIRPETFREGNERIYYILKNINDSRSVIYVPIDSKEIEDGMRRVPTAEEAERMIEDSETVSYDIPEDIKARTALYEEIVRSGNRAEILWLAKELSLKKQRMEGAKKKFYALETHFLSICERIITEDLSFVFKIEKSEVIPYIIKKTHEKA